MLLQFVQTSWRYGCKLCCRHATTAVAATAAKFIKIENGFKAEINSYTFQQFCSTYNLLLIQYPDITFRQ